MKKHNQWKTLAVIAGVAMSAAPQVTTATEGYFQHGWGARHSALAGAGSANVTDASGQAHNPAGLVNVDGSEINFAMTVFNPNRSYTGSAYQSGTPDGGFGFSSFGLTESNSNMFLVPNFAFSSKIDDTSAWGVTLYGNGGMNTDYPAFDRPLPDCPPVGGNGVYCGGSLGVDLVQAFLAVTYAQKMGDFSVGISPIFAFQAFEARGIGAFAAGGFSSDPANFTNNNHDTSTGFGAKIGMGYKVNDELDLALTYQTKIDMSEFDSYAGLFADGGDFDIPSNLTIGASFDVSDNVTIMLDWRQIYYEDAGSVSNPGQVPLLFGMDGGPGFGWDNVTAVKVGVEWKVSDALTWRFGYAENDNPIGPEDVNLNILAPGVVTTHITAGFELALDSGDAFEFSFAYVPEESVSGPGMMNPNHKVTIAMDQMIVGASWTFNLDD